MSSVHPLCACKGIRTCTLCENEKLPGVKKSIEITHLYCPECNRAFATTENSLLTRHPDHSTDFIQIRGVKLFQNAITEEHEKTLVEEIDNDVWISSQSGRLKQDFGPKVNFKKKKIKTETFTGLPSYSKALFEIIKSKDLLKDFIPVELCNLDYSPERGSAIDAHYDDFWLWGERLITLNLLSTTYLTMSNTNLPTVQLAIPLAPRSIVVIYDEARYQWKHAIHRQHITDRRVAITLRELTPEFLCGGEKEDLGTELISKALTFTGRSVGSS